MSKGAFTGDTPDVAYAVAFELRRSEMDPFDKLGCIYGTRNFGEIIKRAVSDALEHAEQKENGYENIEEMV